MICYNCGLKINDINKKECHFCGIKFGPICQSCKSPNPSFANYCYSCGKQLQLKSSEVNNGQIPLTESRKNVAVIFADISGFTKLSEKLDPELVREIINDCFAFITTPVYELGGTIDKYIGDCIMILFGAKNSHVDDAKRAVICSLRMQQLIKEFSEEKLKQYGFVLEISIGIHYGLVVTGGIGNYFDIDYTVMGDTVNTAQRIQSNTPAAKVYVSQSVYQETYEDIEYSSPIEFSVKNKENTVTCYIPHKIKNSVSKINENIPFFGRKAELLVLNDILNQVNLNSNKLVSIIGSSGIGKTRLVNEFLHNVNEKFKIISIECSPVNASKPYSLIEGLLMSIMNITPEDSAIVKKSRLISYVSYIMASDDDAHIKRNYQFLGMIMGLEVDAELKEIINAMDTDNILNELTRQLNRFFEAYVSRFKSIIVLEDIHWCDSRSLLIMQSIWKNLLSINGQGLFLCTSRNSIEEIDTIRHNSSYTVAVDILQSESIKRIAASFIGCSEIHDSFLGYLEKYSGSNPLYIIELLRYIKRNSICYIENDIAYLNNRLEEIPNNIQGLILSKLNDLPSSKVEIIQLASMIGKEFSVSVLNHLLQYDIEAAEALPSINNIFSLKSTFTSGGRLERIYTFNHETEREVIYNSILNKQKTINHKRIGEAIENLYVKTIENYLEILGEHFEKASDNIKAADYYYRAASKHKKLFNSTDAVASFNKALNLYKKCGKHSIDKVYKVCKELGDIYSMISEYEKALSFLDYALENNVERDLYNSIMLVKAKIYQEQGNYSEAMRLLNELQDSIGHANVLYGALLFHKCTILRVTGESEEALKLIKESERILKKNSDFESLAKALNVAGTIYYSRGMLEQALKYYTKSYNNSEKIRDLQTMMKTSTNMAIIYHTQGKISKAMDYFKIALEMSEKLSHRRGYITTCNNLGILYMDKGMFSKAEELFKEAVQNSREASALLYESSSLSNLSDIQYYLGDLVKAKEYAKDALSISVQIKDVEGEAINNIALAKVTIEQGSLLEAEGYLQNAEAIFNQLEYDDGLCDYYYYKGQCSLAKKHYTDAISSAELSIEYAIKYKSDRKSARGYRLKGIALQSLNEWKQSIEDFSQSIEIFEKEESLYEAAKSYYFRAISYKSILMSDEAAKDILTSRQRIQSIDRCKWTTKIEHGIN